MQAEFDHPRSDAFIIVGIIWAAGLVAALAGLLAYLAIQAYDPSVSCDELAGRAFRGTAAGTRPPDPDAWDDWELTCEYWD
jgi:hypothetical protein